MAEWPKAAVCQGCQESQNGPEIYDFRPVFYWDLGWRWLRNDGSWTALGHTGGHTGAGATVCLVGTRRRSELRADPPAPCPLQCVALQLQCTHWRIPSWTIRSPSVCPHRWVARSGEHLAAWDADLRTSSAWHSRRSFREHRQPTVNEPNGWSTSSARCRRESPTWQSDIVSTFSRR